MHEAGELVAGEERLLQRRVARQRQVLGMREDGLDQLVRVSRIAKDLGSVLRVLVQGRVDLVIEVVEQSGRAPELLVLAELARVGGYGRLDRERVAPEGLALRVLREGSPGAVAIHVHGPTSIVRSPWPISSPQNR
jgi:hypothetical protein